MAISISSSFPARCQQRVRRRYTRWGLPPAVPGYWYVLTPSNRIGQLSPLLQQLVAQLLPGHLAGPGSPEAYLLKLLAPFRLPAVACGSVVALPDGRRLLLGSPQRTAPAGLRWVFLSDVTPLLAAGFAPPIPVPAATAPAAAVKQPSVSAPAELLAGQTPTNRLLSVCLYDEQGSCCYAHAPTVKPDTSGWLGLSGAQLAERRALPDYARQWPDYLARCVAGQPVTCTQTTADNRQLQLQLLPLPGYLLELCTDETAVRQQQILVTEQRAFIQQFLHTSPQLMFFMTEEGHVLFANETFRQHPALQPLLADPERVPRRRQAAHRRALLTGEVVRFFLPLTGGGGSQFYDLTLRPLVRTDGTRVVLGVGADLTRWQQAQQALRRREKQYRDLMTHSQALILTHDLTGQILSANPAVARLLGASRSARLVGRRLHEFVPASRQTEVEKYLAAFAAQQHQHGVVEIAGEAAEAAYVLFTNYRLQEAGAAPYVIGYGQDITTRVQANRERQEARRQMEATLAARETFLTTISHELRTPLHALLGLLQEVQAVPALPAAAETRIHTMQRAGQHLLQLVNDALDLTSLRTGQLPLHVQSFNLGELCTQLSALLAPRARAAGLSLHIPAAGQVPWQVMGDTRRLQQVLLNLLGNALKFTRQGSVRLTVRQLPLRPTRKGQHYYAFTVSDTGPGIGTQQLQCLFKPFMLGPDSPQDSTGLGLAISHQLVGRMGGRLRARSRVGAGCTFGFVLPLAPAESPALLSPLAPATGRAVLVVEDVASNRELLVHQLAGWGCRVLAVADAEMARQCLQQQAFELALVDVNLPGMNGSALVEWLRQQPLTRQAYLPVVALTADVSYLAPARYAQSGFTAVLLKPYESASLQQLLQTLWSPSPATILKTLTRQAQGQPAYVGRMLRLYAQELPVAEQVLRQHLATNQVPVAVRQTLHRITPALLTLNGPAAPVIRQLLSQALRDAETYLPTVWQLVHRALHSLSALPHVQEPPTPAPPERLTG